jgi:SAM-dependent methyltransferase
MTVIDVALQAWRLRKALPHVPEAARVLDVGTGDATFFRKSGRVGVGIDPELPAGIHAPHGVTLVKGSFPDDLGDRGRFDAAVALAVVEHVPPTGLDRWQQALRDLLRPDGLVVITVPSPMVDHILHVLMRLRLVDGMEAHQHHGFDPEDVLAVFAAPAWRLVHRKRFQLGLNNLFVFRRETAPA